LFAFGLSLSSCSGLKTCLSVHEGGTSCFARGLRGVGVGARLASFGFELISLFPCGLSLSCRLSSCRNGLVSGCDGLSERGLSFSLLNERGFKECLFSSLSLLSCVLVSRGKSVFRSSLSGVISSSARSLGGLLGLSLAFCGFTFSSCFSRLGNL
jgi:hypothetical protein